MPNIREDIRLYQGVTPIEGGGHIDVPLSNFASVAFSTGTDEFIGEQLLPEIAVGKQSDRYYKIEKDAFFRLPTTTRRAPLQAANRVEFTVSSASYYCQNYALAGENALEHLANADLALNLRMNTVELVTNLLRRDQEIRIANLVTSASNVGSGFLTPTSAQSWFNPAGSNILAQIQTAQAFIRQQTGLLPNVMVLDWDSYQMAKRNTTLFSYVQYNGMVPQQVSEGGLLSDTTLQTVFGVERLLIGRAIKNTAAEQVNVGSTVFTSANVWGNTCLLAHVRPATGLQSMTFGGRFRWRPAGFPAPFQTATAVYDRAGESHSEVIEAQYFQDEQIIATDLAYVIKTSSGETGTP